MTRPPPEFLYLIRSVRGGPSKIGRSLDPKERLDQLKTGSPIPLRILYQWKLDPPTLETDLHRLFARWRVHGEWFNLGDHPIQVVDEAIRHVRGEPPPPRLRRTHRIRDVVLLILALFLILFLAIALDTCQGLGC